MSERLIILEGVSKKFCRSLKKSLLYGLNDLSREIMGFRHGGNGKLRPGEFWALKDLSFELNRGETLGLIGLNGAGKTTLLRMLNGLLKPDAGRIEIRGHINALIALGAGFNPILTGRENIYVNASVLGLKKREIDDKFDEIVEFAELSEFIDSPVQSYSSGMTVRLGFAVATVLRPDILILDEVLAVGDMSFQFKCFNKLAELRNNGVTIILVSHSMLQISRFSDKTLLLQREAPNFLGETESVIEKYLRTTSQKSFYQQDVTNELSEAEEITVDSPCFMSIHGEEISESSPDDFVQIVIPYRINAVHGLIQPVFEIILRTQDGNEFCHTTSKILNILPENIVREGKIIFKMDNIPGNNIQLLLSIMVWDDRNSKLIYWQKGHPKIWITGNPLETGKVRVKMACINSID